MVRVGTVEIGSAALLGLMCIVSVFVYALYKPFLVKLALIPDEVRRVNCGGSSRGRSPTASISRSSG